MNPNYDTNAGWDFGTASPLGGVRSKRLDAAIAEIRAVNPAVAAMIPPYVLGCFWQQPDPHFDFQYHPDRFAKPEGDYPLTDDQLNQILWNQEHRVNFYMGASMWDNKPQTFVSDIYRGRPSDAPLPTADVPPEKTVFFPHPMPYALVPGKFGRMTPQGLPQAMALDHQQCDIWWDLTTDVDVARAARAFARSYGVNVNPEP